MPHWCTRPPSDPPRNPEFSAWSPWPESLLALFEHLAHAEVCDEHLEQLRLRKRKLFDCLQHKISVENAASAWHLFKSIQGRFEFKSFRSQDFRIRCCKRPVWGSSPGRLGTHRALFQLAATWSNDPKKVILQAAPIESETTWNWKYDSWDQQRTTVCNLIRTVQESVYYLFLVNLQLLLHVFHDEVNYVILQTHNLEWLIRFWKTFKSSMSHWFRS